MNSSALNVYNAGQKEHSNSSSDKCLAEDAAMRSLHHYFASLVRAITLKFSGNIRGFMSMLRKNFQINWII